jgi:beta-galactosidase
MGSGEFVWTGFDYLGEPTPYDESWPSKFLFWNQCGFSFA